MKLFLCLASVFAVSALVSQQARACSCCVPSLGSDWEAQGYSIEPGFKLDINYSFIDQSQYRHGTRHISLLEIPDGQEMEKSTRTNTTTLSLDYIINSDWAVDIQVPWIVRDHGTYGEEHDALDTSSTNSIGDIRLSTRYQGFTKRHNFGIELGIKLPTGSFTDSFRSGEALDRGLQPGTGTTDIIAGLYYFDSLSEDWGFFSQFNIKTPLNSRSNYKPGTQESLMAGVRYTGWHTLIPQLQVNGRITSRDSGDEADVPNSGGSSVFLSPGVTYEFNSKLSTYVFVQIPLYQNLNGYQLAPTWTLTAGVRYAF